MAERRTTAHLLVYSANIVWLSFDLISVHEVTDGGASNDDRFLLNVSTLLPAVIYSFADISRQFTGRVTIGHDPDICTVHCNTTSITFRFFRRATQIMPNHVLLPSPRSLVPSGNSWGDVDSARPGIWRTESQGWKCKTSDSAAIRHLTLYSQHIFSWNYKYLEQVMYLL